MWIAFIFQYLWDTKQHSCNIIIDKRCCELLSFFSIFGIQNNSCLFLCPWLKVVNCFHFSVSLGYKTTFRLKHLSTLTLWIAFIFQYLWDTKQLTTVTFLYSNSCELLSFFSIFGIQNNYEDAEDKRFAVVNCFGYAESPCFPFARFHFSVSLGYKTTGKVLLNLH